MGWRPPCKRLNTTLSVVAALVRWRDEGKANLAEKQKLGDFALSENCFPTPGEAVLSSLRTYLP